MPKSKEFVSSSESDSGSDIEPKQKKKKVESKPEKKVESKPEKKAEAKPEKKAEKKEEKGGGDKKKFTTNSSGDKMFQIARMRYVTVSEFRGKVMVGIREFYDADGELRPGKKGISLTMEQWNSLKDHMEDIEEAIKDL